MTRDARDAAGDAAAVTAGGDDDAGTAETDAGTAGGDAGDAATADANADGRYVHRPDGAAPSAEADAGNDVEAATTGVRGWVLVGVVVTCFLVIPGVVYLRPAVPGRLGLPFVVAMLVLPMLPALLLGLTAVWSMRGPRDRDAD